jgi:cation diffusion facilitator family transporter
MLADTEKRRASLISLLVVVFLLSLKVVVALLTGSLGILAQVADSLLDLVATVLAYFAVRVAEQPPDPEHPYGHGKVENLAGLAEALLLLVTCGWIVYEAIQRLFFRSVPIEAGIWGIAVMALSIVASIWLSTYLLRVARRQRSQALEGNALNFRADVLSSSVVLLGLVLVSLSQQLGPQWAWLTKADAVAGLVVALLVLRVSLGLGWRAVSELLDAAPAGLTEQITGAAESVDGVQSVGPVRVRQAGGNTFVDMQVKIRRSASLEEAHQVARAVERRVGDLISPGDVVVHLDPVRQPGESLSQTVSAIAGRRGLQAHDIHAHQIDDDWFVDLHVEVPPALTLAEAHQEVARLEAAVRDELPYVRDIHSHIEPMAVPASSALLDAAAHQQLHDQILEVVAEVAGLSDCHNLFVRPGPDGYDVVIDCLADPDLPVAEAHRLADQAEKLLHLRVAGIGKVLIHVEPRSKAP